MPRKKMSVMIRGVVYESVDEAAAMLGVSPATIYSAVIRGNPDNCGLGRGRTKVRSRGGKPKPVLVAGKVFPSLADLARAIGREPRAVRVSFHAGPKARARILRRVEELIAAEMAAKVRQEAGDRKTPNILPPQPRKVA